MKKNRQAEIAKNLTGKELVFHLLLTQLIIIILAIVLSWILFSDLTAFFNIFKWNTIWIIVGVFSGLAVVALDLLLMKKVPPEYYDDGGINEKIFSNMPVWKIALLSMLIAFAEELLFRGVIHTHYGFWVASIIFALVHIRYLTNWYLLLNVSVLSIWISLLYEYSGQQILPVIFMHFTIDFLLGIKMSRNSIHND
ncbi:CPBP family intramembrane glutamic endopeptidase [Lederbergia panacisoli]|uniref:CPBP family intramembrane glutamic endopeptidase n=1 Tax=Lederbergia panacisoli TaxID=1255251 RepID=UPI00214B985D|nr:CPBP family intramembrane glutamic endopeptidase [Lederbergia panacisoli]MCR2820266.1 CPBP family intramembrane metalloprotease [Lederbergia panacisoli]